jgi:hypothetical protein
MPHKQDGEAVGARVPVVEAPAPEARGEGW